MTTTRAFGKLSRRRSSATQKGAALIVSLIFLMIMTILAISMSQTTSLEERMAGNARDTNSAFQGAETAVISGQTAVVNSAPDDSTLVSNTIDTTVQNDTWWTANGIEFGTTSQDMPKLNSDPHYVVRARALRVGHGTLNPASNDHRTSYYEVVGRSRGTSSDSEAVTSEIVAVPD